MKDSPTERWMQGDPDPFGDAAAFGRSIAGRAGALHHDRPRREALIQAAHKLRMEGRYMQAALVTQQLRESYLESDGA